MKRWMIVLFAWLSWSAPAAAERYILEIPLELQFSRSGAPHHISVECYLGRRSFMLEQIRPGGGGRVTKIGIMPSDLKTREGLLKDWWPLGVRGVTYKRILVKNHFGKSTVRLSYECAGKCKKRYYLCHIPEVDRYFNVNPGSSVTVIRGVIGENRPADPKPGLLDSPPTPGEGLVNSWARINAKGSQCKLDVECNSMFFEGSCVKGTCVGFPRAECTDTGQTFRCMIQSSQKIGYRTCAPVYIAGKHNRWGDCQIPE